MSFDITTPERKAKIAAYLRMLERTAPVWKPEYLKPLEKKREKDQEKKK